jgi:hypothetical protein
MSFRKIIGIASALALGATTVYGMGCSSSTNSGTPTAQDSGTKTDTGTGKDSSVTDTGGGDSSGGDAGGDAGGTCPTLTAFTAIKWAPPTPIHQGVCTAAQITAWDTSGMANMTTGLGTSGNPACDACIVTAETASMHGPVITQIDPMSNMAFLAEFNIGGCVADEDGMTAAGSCGNQLNNQGDCLFQECGACSDFNSNPTPKGGPTSMCEQAVFGATGDICTASAITSTCLTALGQDGGQQACLSVSSNAQFFSLWCGAATTPADSGTDTGTPTDSGGGG